MKRQEGLQALQVFGFQQVGQRASRQLREGCVACHTPHGSFTQKLLHKRDANLCIKCHAQVQTTAGEVVFGNTTHTAFIRRGTCWSAGCHTAVHGSNIDPKLRY